MSEQRVKKGNETMVVSKIKIDGNRLLLYDKKSGPLNYHVIANIKEEVKAGDRIEFEPYGANFGWFVRVL